MFKKCAKFYLGYIYKRKLNVKIKNSACAKSEKLAFIYALCSWKDC